MRAAGVFSTPRPMPPRVLPVVAGGVVIALALPVFALAGWPLQGWALAAVLWVAAQGLGLLLTRLRLGADNLAASGLMGIVMSFRPIAVMVVVIAVAASDAELGLAAGLLYAFAYTLELAVSLVLFFGGSPAR
jgi:hypothetical protein